MQRGNGHCYMEIFKLSLFQAAPARVRALPRPSEGSSSSWVLTSAPRPAPPGEIRAPRWPDPSPPSAPARRGLPQAARARPGASRARLTYSAGGGGPGGRTPVRPPSRGLALSSMETSAPPYHRLRVLIWQARQRRIRVRQPSRGRGLGLGPPGSVLRAGPGRAGRAGAEAA